MVELFFIKYIYFIVADWRTYTKSLDTKWLSQAFSMLDNLFLL